MAAIRPAVIAVCGSRLSSFRAGFHSVECAPSPSRATLCMVCSYSDLSSVCPALKPASDCSRDGSNVPSFRGGTGAKTFCADRMLTVPPLPYRRYQTTAPHPRKNNPSNIPFGCPAAAARRKHIPPTTRNKPIYTLTGITVHSSFHRRHDRAHQPAFPFWHRCFDWVHPRFACASSVLSLRLVAQKRIPPGSIPVHSDCQSAASTETTA